MAAEERPETFRDVPERELIVGQGLSQLLTLRLDQQSTLINMSRRRRQRRLGVWMDACVGRKVSAKA